MDNHDCVSLQVIRDLEQIPHIPTPKNGFSQMSTDIQKRTMSKSLQGTNQKQWAEVDDNQNNNYDNNNYDNNNNNYNNYNGNDNEDKSQDYG